MSDSEYVQDSLPLLCSLLRQLISAPHFCLPGTWHTQAALFNKPRWISSPYTYCPARTPPLRPFFRTVGEPFFNPLLLFSWKSCQRFWTHGCEVEPEGLLELWDWWYQGMRGLGMSENRERVRRPGGALWEYIYIFNMKVTMCLWIHWPWWLCAESSGSQ